MFSRLANDAGEMSPPDLLEAIAAFTTASAEIDAEIVAASSVDTLNEVNSAASTMMRPRKDSTQVKATRSAVSTSQ